MGNVCPSCCDTHEQPEKPSNEKSGGSSDSSSVDKEQSKNLIKFSQKTQADNTSNDSKQRLLNDELKPAGSGDSDLVSNHSEQSEVGVDPLTQSPQSTNGLDHDKREKAQASPHPFWVKEAGRERGVSLSGAVTHKSDDQEGRGPPNSFRSLSVAQ